jgi:hypothetical protein
MSLQGLLPELLGLITAKLENWTDLVSFYGTCRALHAVRKKYPKTGPLHCVKNGKLLWWRGKHSRGELLNKYGVFTVTYITGGIFVVNYYELEIVIRQDLERIQNVNLNELPWVFKYIVPQLMPSPTTRDLVCVYRRYMYSWEEALFFETITQGQEALDEIAYYAKIFSNQGVTE